MELTKGDAVYIELHPYHQDRIGGNFRHMRWYGGMNYRFIHNISSTYAFVSSVDETKRWHKYSHTERELVPIKTIIKIGTKRYEQALRKDKSLIKKAKQFGGF